MATVQEWPAPTWSLDQLRRHFGGIPAHRIFRYPRPGTATEKDLVLANERDKVRNTCELVDGCLVEKGMGAREALLAGIILQMLNNYFLKFPVGVALAPDGTLRLMPGLVRAPDVCFISWDRIGADEFPENPIPDLVPELAIEIWSKWNTKKEIARKILDYFSQGVLEVWVIDPRKRSGTVYHSPDDGTTVGIDGALECPKLLPGFKLSLSELFAAQKRRGKR
jgi:Uma2 family endonuclease